MTQHLWITAPQHRDREAAIAPLDLPPLLGRVDAHRRRRGPYSAAGELLRALVPGLLATRPGLVRRHDIELLTAAPELAAILTCERSSLTWTSDAEERTRFYPRAQTTRVGHGLTELLAACGDGRALVIENLHEADPTDAELVAIMLRRVDPEVLRLVITSRDEAPEHALEVHAPATRAPAGARSAAAYVAADCTSDEPAQIAAYEALEPAERAALHDARAHELEGRDEASLRLGAIPFHREHGSDPRGAGAAALSAALEHCVLLGFYHAVLDLGARALALLDWAEDPKACWLVVAKVTTALTALGRPDEAAELYDDACAATADPSVHLQAAYGRAMLFTRFYEGERRDHRTAKRHINTAIALASQMPASEARAFNLTFQENGLALIEMHLGDGARALRLVTDGLRRLDEELEPGTQTLQRSVLRYNRAQLLARMGPPAAALREYSEAIEVDPHHSEYYFERAAVQRKLGRAEAALADYNAAIRLSPPYPEAYYNRGDLLLELGRVEAALADFSYVLELDPEFLDAYVNRASALLDLGELDAARRDADAGLRLDPEQPHLHCVRAMVSWQQGELEQAHDEFAAALGAEPALVPAWSNRAVLYFEQGRLDAAIECLNRAIELDDDPVLRENRALALEQAGRLEEATRDREALQAA